MEQEYKIAALIQRYVSGDATEEERYEVERWMAESEEHGVLMEKFRSDAFWQEQLAEHDIFDVDVAFKRFRKSKRAKSVVCWLSDGRGGCCSFCGVGSSNL